MKVVFLQKDSFVRIAVEQLSAVLKAKGHECDIFLESGERDLLAAALASGGDLFAFSCTTGGEGWIARVASELKRERDTPILVGGPHPTFYPQFIEAEPIDYICRGEGEHALVRLLDVLHDPSEIAAIPNIWSKSPDGRVKENPVAPLIQDLDSMPIPDFGIYLKYRYMVPFYREMYPVMTGRGCPKNCSYCFNKTYKELYSGGQRYLRRRSPEHVIGELLQAKNRYGVRKINFVDDSFFLFPRWLEKFGDLYTKKIRLPFIVNVEATMVSDDQVRLIKEMGCICVRMGVETGNDHLRQDVLNKKVTSLQIAEAARSIKGHGIMLATYNILGLPGETVENALETLEFNKKIRSNFAWCSLLQPYPGTALYRFVSENGLLEDNSHTHELDESFFASSGIRLKDESQIVNLQRLLQFFLIFHIPQTIIRWMIRLPKNAVFDLVFKATYIYSKLRSQRIRLWVVALLGWHSRSYMSGRKTVAPETRCEGAIEAGG